MSVRCATNPRLLPQIRLGVTAKPRAEPRRSVCAASNTGSAHRRLHRRAIRRHVRAFEHDRAEVAVLVDEFPGGGDGVGRHPCWSSVPRAIADRAREVAVGSTPATGVAGSTPTPARTSGVRSAVEYVTMPTRRRPRQRPRDQRHLQQRRGQHRHRQRLRERALPAGEESAGGRDARRSPRPPARGPLHEGRQQGVARAMDYGVDRGAGDRRDPDRERERRGEPTSPRMRGNAVSSIRIPSGAVGGRTS